MGEMMMGDAPPAYYCDAARPVAGREAACGAPEGAEGGIHSAEAAALRLRNRCAPPAHRLRGEHEHPTHTHTHTCS